MTGEEVAHMDQHVTHYDNTPFDNLRIIKFECIFSVNKAELSYKIDKTMGYITPEIKNSENNAPTKIM